MNKGSNDFLRALFGEKNDLVMSDDFTDADLIGLIKTNVTEEEFKSLDAYFGLVSKVADSTKYESVELIVRKLKGSKTGIGRAVWNHLEK